MTLKHFIPSRIRLATQYVLPTTRATAFRSVRGAPVDDPLQRWVRQREKERIFSVLPPPRMVPQPKKHKANMLKPLLGWGGYDINGHCLEARLQFLLSEEAVKQQTEAPICYGQDPYTAERVMWERQLRELRRLYRLLYVNKLSDVINIERKKQKEILDCEAQERWRKRLERHESVCEEQKRQAIHRERKRVDRVVQEMVDASRVNTEKKQILKTLGAAEDTSKFLKGGKTFDVEDTFDRDEVFAPDIMRDLDKIDDESESVTLSAGRRPPNTEQVYRRLVRMSYEALGEDCGNKVDDSEIETLASRGAEVEGTERRLDEMEKARLMFSAFTEEEKVKLLQQKINILNSRVGGDASNDTERKVLNLLKAAAKDIDCASQKFKKS